MEALKKADFGKGKEWGRKQLKKITGSEIDKLYGGSRGYDGTTPRYPGNDSRHMNEKSSRRPEDISRKLCRMSCGDMDDRTYTRNHAHARSADRGMCTNDYAHARSLSRASPYSVGNSYRSSYCNAPFLGAGAGQDELPYNIPHETYECCQNQCHECMVERQFGRKQPATPYSHRQRHAQSSTAPSRSRRAIPGQECDDRRSDSHSSSGSGRLRRWSGEHDGEQDGEYGFDDQKQLHHRRSYNDAKPTLSQLRKVSHRGDVFMGKHGHW